MTMPHELKGMLIEIATNRYESEEGHAMMQHLYFIEVTGRIPILKKYEV